jgi:hypothetical protein
MNMILSHLNFRLLEFAGIQDTFLGFKNLTKKDEVRQGELDTQAIENGSKTWNEVRTARGDGPYLDENGKPAEWANVPYASIQTRPAPTLFNLPLATPGNPLTPISEAMKNELCRDGVQQASLTPRQKQRQSLLELNVQKYLEEQEWVKVL